MGTKKSRDLKIQVAEDIKVLEASVTVVKAADNVAEIKSGDSLDQKIITAMPLTPELLEVMAKKVKDLLGEQSSAIKASGDSQFEGFVVRGVESRLIAIGTTSSAILLNKDYLAGQHDKATIIQNIESINIYHGDESRKDQLPFTEESIKKLTFGQLVRTLSVGAWIWIIGLLFIAIGFSYGVGYKQGVHQFTQTPSLKQLNSYQIELLKEIYNYEKTNGVNRVIILRTGIIFDEASKKETPINVAVDILGVRTDQRRFEDLVISVPEHYLHRLPLVAWGDPYTLTVTKEARKLLDNE